MPATKAMPPFTVMWQANAYITRSRVSQGQRRHTQGTRLSPPTVEDYNRQEIYIVPLDPEGVVEGAPTIGDPGQQLFIDQNTNKTFLQVENPSGSEKTFTILTTVEDIDGLDVPDRLVTVPGNGRVVIPLRTSIYNIQSGDDLGKVWINVTSAGLEFWAYQMPT